MEILDLTKQVRKVDKTIPKGFKGADYDSVFGLFVDRILTAQYMLNSINELTHSEFEINIVNLRDKS